MVLETISRGPLSWTILYGYGRLQKARVILVSGVPESIKRAQIADPELDPKDALLKVTAEEIVSAESDMARKIACLVLDSAPDWDKTMMTAEDYVDTTLPPDVGTEILSRVSKAVNDFSVPQDQKKD